MKARKTPLWYLLSLSVFLLLVSSCKDREEDISFAFTDGFFVVCEGNFMSGNASVSHYSNGSATNEIFKKTNKRPLGDQAQSIIIHDNEAYIMVQNSGRIEVVNATTFKLIATIDNRISNPRNMVVYNNTGYVSDWTSNKIKIINLSTYEVTDSIAVDEVPEALLIKGTTLYVSNAGLNYGKGTHISIIDLTSNTKTGSITTPANPGEMVLDADGNIWTLCGGDAWTSVDATLIKIDPDDNTIVTTINFDEAGDYPYRLKTNAAKDQLYFTILGELFECPLTISAQPTTPKIARSFYSFDVNPANDDIIALIAPNFTAGGKVVRYDSDGLKLDSAVVGIAPGCVVFK